MDESGFTLNDIIKGAGSVLGGTSELGKLGQFLGFGGLAALANQSSFFNPKQQRVGFQGTTQPFRATRIQTPLAQQRPAGYRPGQGGITYFLPTHYQRPGEPEFVPPAQVDPRTNPNASFAAGGIAELSRGRYIRGNGDGVSDDVPAQFESGEPAKLADGEFVIPARIVAEIGNGSSDAGAEKLYAMLDRIEARMRKHKRGEPSGADRELTKLG